jgi:hypothetical protein
MPYKRSLPGCPLRVHDNVLALLRPHEFGITISLSLPLRAMIIYTCSLSTCVNDHACLLSALCFKYLHLQTDAQLIMFLIRLEPPVHRDLNL